MKKFLLALFLNLFFLHTAIAQLNQDKITIVLHGGAGTISRENMTAEQEKAYKLGLQSALDQGYSVLQQGGSSIDAVKAAIVCLENNPLFNAGKGAVFTNEGKNELDASLMDGSNRKAGAVAGVTNVKNPILAAEAVMSKSSHVMMSGAGAEKFAKSQGLEIVNPSYFFTEKRYQGLLKAKAQERIQLDHTEESKQHIKKSPKTGYQTTSDLIFTEGNKFGTVGCVALDQFGNLAAGTSTGGMTNKRYGRIGDAPIIGAGTYADNETCAVSATGHGEFFIRNVVAYDISALMKYKGLTVQEAAEEVVMHKLVQQGGDGGVIALDKHGNISMPFNTSGMYRAFKNGTGKSEILIYKD